MKLFIEIGNFRLPTYGLMIIIGVAIANLIAIKLIKKYKLDHLDFIILESYTFLGAILGAKLLYFIVSFDEIDFSRIFEWSYLKLLLQGGFVFYGGLIGGIFTAFLAGKIHKINTITYMKTVICLIPIIHAFGRIGCFLAGCCYGKPYDGVFAVVFPEKSLAPPGIPLFPVQLFEAICLLLIGFTILILQLKFNFSKTVELYLILYGILRFILEYLRYDEARGHLLFFSTSQWISIILILFIVLKEIILNVKKHKKISTDA